MWTVTSDKINSRFNIGIVNHDPVPAIQLMREINESLPEPTKKINVKVIMLVVFSVLFLLHPLAIYDIDVAFEKMFYMLAAFLVTFAPMSLYSMFYK